MKLLLINPPPVSFSDGLSPDQIPRFRQVVRSSRTLTERLEFSRRALSCLGLLTAASVVRERIPEAELQLIDLGLDPDQPIPWADHDLVALTGNAFQIRQLLELISSARRAGKPVLVGGPGAMTFPEVLGKAGVSLALGEAEAVLPAFLADQAVGSVQPVYRAPTGPGRDLAASPAPAFGLAEQGDYTMVGVQTSRGCPHRCRFCQVSSLLGSEYRHKPIDRVVKEIIAVKERWPEAFFFFHDDNLLADEAYAAALFQTLLDQGVSLGRWGANAEATIYRRAKLLDLAQQLGDLDYLGVGFESLSQASLASVGNRMKSNLAEHYRQAVQVLTDRGIGLFAYFIIGFDHDVLEDVDRMTDFIVEQRICGQISRLTPMPGTGLYEDLFRDYQAQRGRLTKGPLGRWAALRKYQLDRAGLDEAELTARLAQAYARIYDDNLQAGRPLSPAPFI